MNRQNELIKNIDWLSIFLYVVLVFMGWLNIYAAVYDDNHSSILDISQKYGKQLIWISASFVLGFFILLTDRITMMLLMRIVRQGSVPRYLWIFLTVRMVW